MAVETKDYMKSKAHELISNKEEEITLHNDVIRSTTMYDDDGSVKIKQNEFPSAAQPQRPLQPVPQNAELQKQYRDYWETDNPRKNSAGEADAKQPEKEEKQDDDINII